MSSVAEHFEQQLVSIRRHLHANPELSHEEVATSAYIRDRLVEAGIRIVDYGLPTGVIAEVGGLHDGPIIAIRADIDALPIQEQTGLPYASTVDGKMHACGHDFHTAVVIGAALLLKSKEHQLKGTVRFLFQPAEEKAQGANLLISRGVLHNVAAIFGLHNKPDLPVGTIGIKGGALMAAADGFKVEVTGYGSHAAVPEAGRDPVLTAAHILTALQSIVSRNVSPLHSAVVSVTRLHSGTVWNVIPEKAVLDGTIRTFDKQVRLRVLERFEQIVHGVAQAFDSTAEIKWIDGPPAVVNDAQLGQLATKTAESLGLHVIEPTPSLAGEDFAFYQQHIPGLFVFLGTFGPQEWHHPSFDVDERALPIGASLFAAIAVDALTNLTAGTTQ